MRAKPSRFVSRRSVLGVVATSLFAAALGACVDVGGAGAYPNQASAEITDDGTLLVHVSVDFYASHHPYSFYLDRASLTVSGPLGNTQIDDPTLDLSDFPLVVEGDRSITIDLSAPSPIPKVTSVPAYCDSSNAFVTYEIDFYTPEGDRDPDKPAELQSVVGAVSLVPTTLPPPSGVFFPTSVNPIPSLTLSLDAATSTPTISDKAAFAFADADAGELSLLFSDSDSQQSVSVPLSTETDVALSTTPDGSMVAATTTSSGAVSLFAFSSTNQIAEAHFQGLNTAGAGTFRVSSALGLAPIGQDGPLRVRVAFESDAPLDFGTGTVVAPVPDKYFTGYFATLSADGTVTDEALAPGDMLAMIALPGGDELWAYGDLPPLDGARMLHVERRSAVGDAIWSASYPALTYAVDVTPTPDGGALVVVNEATSGPSIIVLRFDGTGQLVFSKSFAGSSGSGTVLGDGRVLIAFTGPGIVGAAEEVASAGSAPVLVELDAAGKPVRALTIACSGGLRIEGTPDGGAMLLVGYGDLASIGDEVSQASSSGISAGLAARFDPAL